MLRIAQDVFEGRLLPWIEFTRGLAMLVFPQKGSLKELRLHAP